MNVEKIREAVERSVEMLKVAAHHCQEYGASGVTDYDGAECDGLCIASDCIAAADDLESALSEPSPVMSEAVAWYLKHKDGRETLTVMPKLAQTYKELGSEVYPLYAQPTPTTVQPNDERDALLIEAAEWCERMAMYDSLGYISGRSDTWKKRASRLRAAIKPTKPLSECHTMKDDQGCDRN